MSQSTGVMSEIYDGSAELGNITSMIYLIISIVIGVVLIIFAIMNFISTPTTTSTMVNHETKTTTSSGYVAGIVSLVIAIIIVGLSYLNYYLTTNFKAYAAVEGIGTVANIIS